MRSTVKLFSESIFCILEVKDRLFKHSRNSRFLVENVIFYPKSFVRLNYSSLYRECGTENRFQIHTLVKSVQL